MRWVLTSLFCLMATAIFAVDSRPYGRVEPLALGEVRWTDGFWADRFELCRTQMIPGMETLMEGTNYTQFFRNFEIAAGLAEGKSRGAPFNDGDFYRLPINSVSTKEKQSQPAKQKLDLRSPSP